LWRADGAEIKRKKKGNAFREGGTWTAAGQITKTGRKTRRVFCQQPGKAAEATIKHEYDEKVKVV